MNAKMAKMLRRIERGDNKSKRLFNNLDAAAKCQLRKNVEEFERIKAQAELPSHSTDEPVMVTEVDNGV